jgi:leucyl aminopeptidase
MLAADLEEAGRVSGEKVWRLPLSDGYKKMMKSPIADILNSNLNGRAHPVQGATFLTWFAPADVPWAHIDIAGMANSDTDLDMLPKGPTGFGVRFLADLLRTRPSVLPLDW